MTKCFLSFIKGLIHYKLVTHAFIDGYSCFVTEICISNNNRAETVLDLFLSMIQ